MCNAGDATRNANADACNASSSLEKRRRRTETCGHAPRTALAVTLPSNVVPETDSAGLRSRPEAGEMRRRQQECGRRNILQPRRLRHRTIRTLNAFYSGETVATGTQIRCEVPDYAAATSGSSVTQAVVSATALADWHPRVVRGRAGLFERPQVCRPRLATLPACGTAHRRLPPSPASCRCRRTR